MENPNPVYTVDEALLSLGFGKFQGLVLVYAGMGWVSEAMEMMLLSFIAPAVRSKWGISPAQQSLITSIVFVGMLIGAYSWGVVSDRYGRRKGFLMTALFTAVAGLTSAFAPNYTALIILRFWVGVGLGGGPVLATWFLEFVPAPNRGTWMMVFSTFWTAGTIFEASLAWLVMPKLGWRWLLGLSCIPTSFLLFFYFFTLESPRYLCLKGRTDDAQKILEKVATMNGKELPPGMLVSEKKSDLHNPSEDAPGVKPKAHAFSILTLLTPKLIRTTLLIWVVFFANAFAYYGLVLLTTELTSNDNKCLHGDHAKKAKHVNQYKDVFITTFAEFPGLLIAAVAIDRIGRKLSMICLFALCCIFLIPLLFHQSEGVITVLLFGARMCITGTFAIVFIYAPEVYPTSVRSTGFGTGSAVGRLGGIVCPYVAVALVQGCHQREAIILFEIVVFMAAVAVFLLPVETKGCELKNTVPTTTRVETKDLELKNTVPTTTRVETKDLELKNTVPAINQAV